MQTQSPAIPSSSENSNGNPDDPGLSPRHGTHPPPTPTAQGIALAIVGSCNIRSKGTIISAIQDFCDETDAIVDEIVTGSDVSYDQTRQPIGAEYHARMTG